MTTIETARQSLSVSRLGASNPLPVYRWQQPTKFLPAPPSPELTPEEADGAFQWGAASILPYQVQDDYDRAQAPGALDVVTVENEHLRFTVLPQYGGRMASLVDKADGRELLFRNPVFQPANLASLNAWFSGGIEWNGLIPGHSPFTCSPVFVAVVDTEMGPILRLYEYDRIRESAWQVDLFLPEDEARLWIHISLTNPNAEAVPCYWWTNIAAPLEEGTRVLSPADYSIEHVLPDNHLAPFEFPHGHGFDGSYPNHYRDSASVFYRKPGRVRPWIASFQGDGAGLFETSTGTLAGRKLFTWGTGPGGRRWTDLLSLPGEGAYIELQAGVAPTQNQEFALGGGETLQWTECICPMRIDPAQGHDPDYAAACAAMETIVFAEAPERLLAERDAWLATQATAPVSETLHFGRAWGMLHERMAGARISPGLRFDVAPADEACWAELLDGGAFSPQTLAESPRTWAVSDRWMGALAESAQAHGTTWLHELFLGAGFLDRDQRTKAKEHFQRSSQLRDNYLADRHLALLRVLDGDAPAAWESYRKAWANADGNTHLAVEICRFLQENGMNAQLVAFVSELPPVTRGHERIRLAQAQVALLQGDYAQVLDVLNGRFATIREGETLLTDLWFAAHRQQAAQEKGRPLTEQESADVDRRNPPPQRIDFRMKTDMKTDMEKDAG